MIKKAVFPVAGLGPRFFASHQSFGQRIDEYERLEAEIKALKLEVSEQKIANRAGI